jgi:oligopeptide transport system permease protein
MARSYDITSKAAELRSRGMSAARAGRLQEARAIFVESLKYDPHNANVFLWLAGVASSEREAYQFLDRARRLDPDHPQLARVAEGIHQYFARRRQKPTGVAPPTVPVYARPSSQVSEEAPSARSSPQVARGLLDDIASVLLRFAWRFLSIPVIMVVTIFALALIVKLGQEGDLRTLPSAVPHAAGFTTSYLKGLAQGDLGIITSARRSVAGTPVIDELRRALPISLGLLATALTLATVVGLALGIGVALQRSTRLSGALLFASVLGISTPSFFAAMLLIWLGVWLYRATGTHFFPISGFGWDAHLLLPAIVLAARPAATMTRLSYNALVEILRADYVRTAVAKGLVPRLILWRHVLRNAGVPLLTTIGVSLRFSLAVLPIVEYIFGWPGIGRRLLTAIHAQDTTTVVGMTLPLILLFVLVNLVLEVLYPLVDPRLRTSEVNVK